jgi:hypothetical protein
MSYKRPFTAFLLIFLVHITFESGTVSAGNAALNSYAWSENIGWINFSPDEGPGVMVGSSIVTGFAWAENIGWINLSPTFGGVKNDGAGRLSGFAWGENIGWINFAPTGGGVTYNSLTGRFSGFAWGENIGWLSFADFPINSWVSFASIGATQTSPNTHGCPAGFVGTFFFAARLTNRNINILLSDLQAKTKTLTNGNLLRNADGGPSGVGASLTIAKVGSYSDGVLSPNEFVDVPFVICLKNLSRFGFFVDVLGMGE